MFFRILALCFISGLLLTSCSYNPLKPWALIVCDGILDDGVRCENIRYVIQGYSSKKECFEKGLEIVKEYGFECGKECEKPEHHGVICNEICNSKGCRGKKGAWEYY